MTKEICTLPRYIPCGLETVFFELGELNAVDVSIKLDGVVTRKIVCLKGSEHNIETFLNNMKYIIDLLGNLWKDIDGGNRDRDYRKKEK